MDVVLRSRAWLDLVVFLRYRSLMFVVHLFLCFALLQVSSTSTPLAPPDKISDQAETNPTDISKLRARAEAGNADAQFRLGNAYENGKVVSQDYALALTWYKKAAEQGYPAAENGLGVMYLLGHGVEKNKEEAVHWYRRAAKLGSREAMFNLGASYYNGDGVGENPIWAYAWFLLSQEAGDSAAEDAVRRSAAELPQHLGDDAFLEVAEMYEKGEDLPQSYISAAYWYRKVANRNPEAAIKLATLLINGTGMAPDYGEAMALCNSAVKKGNVGGSYCLGYLYQHGLGTAPDSKKAIKWYDEATAQGSTKAALALAELYIKGDGIAVDRPGAFYYLYLAYKTGALGAKDQAHSLRQEMSKDELKRLEKRLREHSFDPKKVFAIVDGPTPPNPAMSGRQPMP
jgi:TPR repeat protein